MLRPCPPDIKARYGPARPETLPGTAFQSAFFCATTVMMTFNLFDLVVLDWILFGLFLPRWAMLPGTEDMESYKDYSFAFKGFLKGCVISVIIGLIVAGVSAAVA